MGGGPVKGFNNPEVSYGFKPVWIRICNLPPWSGSGSINSELWLRIRVLTVYQRLKEIFFKVQYLFIVIDFGVSV